MPCHLRKEGMYAVQYVKMRGGVLFFTYIIAFLTDNNISVANASLPRRGTIPTILLIELPTAVLTFGSSDGL